jgi:16S rRNA (cytosine1402-N4)-methyltransferase
MHIPVLLNEIIECLNPSPGQKFIDATADGGGHATAILRKIAPGGKLLAIEWDPALAANLDEKLKSLGLDYVVIANDSYVNLKNIAESNGFDKVSGILFDLGLSSLHYELSRGFTFQKDEPLDMRYNQNDETLDTAEQIVNKYKESELERILKDYGEEGFAKAIAGSIAVARELSPIKSTFQLVEIIKSAVPFWYRKRRIHFATKTFQALRIAVNKELENIEKGLDQAVDLLDNGGRLAVISFHSLEDRIVKNFFRARGAKKVKKSKYKKEEVPEVSSLRIITKKPIQAGLAEITANPRARSAKLRVLEKNY